MAVRRKHRRTDVRITVVPEAEAVPPDGVVVDIVDGEWPKQRPDPSISAVAVSPPSVRDAASMPARQRCGRGDLSARRRLAKLGIRGALDVLGSDGAVTSKSPGVALIAPATRRGRARILRSQGDRNHDAVWPAPHSTSALLASLTAIPMRNLDMAHSRAKPHRVSLDDSNAGRNRKFLHLCAVSLTLHEREPIKSGLIRQSGLNGNPLICTPSVNALRDRRRLINMQDQIDRDFANEEDARSAMVAAVRYLLKDTAGSAREGIVRGIVESIREVANDPASPGARVVRHAPMNRVTYKAYTIDAYRRDVDRWRATIRRLDGKKIRVAVPPSIQRRDHYRDNAQSPRRRSSLRKKRSMAAR